MTGIVIQARMGSTRSPGEVMSMIAGQPLLHNVIRRCNKSRYAERIIVATTETQTGSHIMVANMLKSFGITNLGWYENIDLKKLPRIILREMDFMDAKKRRLSELFSKFDGKGAMRTAKVIVDEVNKRW